MELHMLEFQISDYLIICLDLSKQFEMFSFTEVVYNK